MFAWEPLGNGGAGRGDERLATAEDQAMRVHAGCVGPIEKTLCSRDTCARPLPVASGNAERKRKTSRNCRPRLERLSSRTTLLPVSSTRERSRSRSGAGSRWGSSWSSRGQ